jgi:hypothetical protein
MRKNLTNAFTMEFEIVHLKSGEKTYKSFESNTDWFHAVFNVMKLTYDERYYSWKLLDKSV